MFSIFYSSGEFGICSKSMSVRELTVSQVRASALCSMLNRYEASEIHLMDIIEDWLASV